MTLDACQMRRASDSERCGLPPSDQTHVPFGSGHSYLPRHGFARLVRPDWDAAGEETRVCLVPWCNTRQAEHDRTFPETLYREDADGRVEPVPVGLEVNDRA